MEFRSKQNYPRRLLVFPDTCLILLRCTHPTPRLSSFHPFHDVFSNLQGFGDNILNSMDAACYTTTSLPLLHILRLHIILSIHIPLCRIGVFPNYHSYYTYSMSSHLILSYLILSYLILSILSYLILLFRIVSYLIYLAIYLPTYLSTPPIYLMCFYYF